MKSLTASSALAPASSPTPAHLGPTRALDPGHDQSRPYNELRTGVIDRALVRRGILPALITLAAAGGATVLAVQFYRRPEEIAATIARAGLLMTGAREETCQVGGPEGLPIHYFCSGRRGTPIVMIHGLGSSAATWSPLMLRLSKEYLVYAPDMPGFGRTPIAPEGVNIGTHVLYLKRFLDALGFPRVTLVGNSLGGWIATRFAATYPENVERLYLLNSAGLRREGMNSPYAVDRNAAKRSIENMFGHPLPFPGFVLDAMVRTSQAPAYRDFVMNYDAREELDSILGDVQAPTTVIWGVQDNILPITCAHELHEGIANSTLVLLHGVGHMPQLQATAQVARIILQD